MSIRSYTSYQRRRMCALLALLGIVLVSIGGCAARAEEEATITVTPTAIALAEAEIINPLRGLYRWYGAAPIPQPGPAADHYTRYGWRVLEPERGVYDFTPIERALAEAKRSGAKFAFRVMAINEFDSPVETPAYLGSEAGGSWCYYGGKPLWVPAWDNTAFLARAQALMSALGQRFDGDPRLGYYDMGLYGHWGEWHTSTLCTPAASSATKRALVDMQLNAFTKTRVIMNAGAIEGDAFAYALNRSPRIGIRADNLCDTWFGNQFSASAEKLALARERWKTAPIITEFFSPNPRDIALCTQQVRDWHVAAIANGRLTWSDYSAEQQQVVLSMGKQTGYRFVLESLRYPATVAASTPFSVTSSWSNVGVTPAYEPVVVRYELRPVAEDRVVWSADSQLDLTQLLPTKAPQPVNDSFRILGQIPPGQYRLSLAVLDPSGYRAPLAIAIQGRDSNGRYPLGTVMVIIGPPSAVVFLPLLRS